MKRGRLFNSTVVLLNLVFLMTDSVYGQLTPASPGKTVEERLSELEQEIAVLKRLKELGDEERRKEKELTPVVSAGEKGFGFKSPDENFEIKFRGYTHFDSRFFADDDTNPGTDQFLLRRVRPILEGKLSKYVGFRIMPDYNGSQLSLQDAYADFFIHKGFNIRAGKFKSPFGLERLQSATNMLFVERAFPTNLVPNRDLGIDFYGEVLDGRVNYDVGVFNGVADGSSLDTDTSDDKDLVARIFSHPFLGSDYEYLEGLGLGFAASYGKAHGNTTTSGLPALRTPGQQNLLRYNTGVFVDGKRFRFSPQAYYYNGPLGLLAEYVYSEQETRLGTRNADLSNQAWQVAASYVLTGEENTYKGVKVLKPFDRSKGQWGVFEAVTRLSGITTDEESYPFFANLTSSSREAIAWGVGLNWHINKNLKFMTDFEQTFFEAGRPGGADREKENFLASRLQVGF